MNNMYDADYGLWLADQMQALEQHRWEELDIPHLIEELEGLNRSNKRELRIYLVVLLTHLLKWEYQPKQRSGSWSGSIKNSRKQIEKLFKDQPSLKNYLPEILESAYEDALEWAAEETGIRIVLFPLNCPYTIVQLLERNWFPD